MVHVHKTRCRICEVALVVEVKKLDHRRCTAAKMNATRHTDIDMKVFIDYRSRVTKKNMHMDGLNIQDNTYENRANEIRTDIVKLLSGILRCSDEQKDDWRSLTTDQDGTNITKEREDIATANIQ